jgi:hypothetical protein
MQGYSPNWGGGDVSFGVEQVWPVKPSVAVLVPPVPVVTSVRLWTKFGPAHRNKSVSTPPARCPASAQVCSVALPPMPSVFLASYMNGLPLIMA